MAYLILDLDETTFVIDGPEYLEDIDTVRHQLSRPFAVPLSETKNVFVKLINPTLLSDLIEHVCLNHEGIIFLTRGSWSKKVLDILALQLNLSEKARPIFMNSRFHSITTDVEYFKQFGFDAEDIRALNKDIRLHHIIKWYPELAGKKFVALDDDEVQMAAFDRGCEKDIFSIQATTLKTQGYTVSTRKEFYTKTLFALDSISNFEKSLPPQPPVPKVAPKIKKGIESYNTYKHFFNRVEDSKSLNKSDEALHKIIKDKTY